MESVRTVNNVEEIMLSIIVPTYGHEKYIAQALDSILMQITKYKFEVLIGEDKSPDRTKKILQEYEQKYPGRFRMFYREKNMNGDKNSIGNALDLRLKSKGKYMINLEGDDYWLSTDKIERQIEFLESHPEYIAVAHNCKVVDENSQPIIFNYSECHDTEYKLIHYMHDIFPGQLTTVMYRNMWIDENFDKSVFYRRVGTGDRLLYFVLASNGKIYCMQESMSAYRYVTSGGYSYSANAKYNYEKKEWFSRTILNYAYSLDNKEAEICAETLYFAGAIRGLISGNVSKGKIVTSLKENMKHYVRPLIYFIRRVVNTKLLKRKSFDSYP